MTDSYAFTAFGVPVAASGATTNPHRYIGALGYYTDPTTGLAYVRARYLRPTTGSWLSVDPVPSEPRYRYVDAWVASVSDASGSGGLRDVLLARYERLRRAVQRSNTHIRPPLVGDAPPRPRLRDADTLDLIRDFGSSARNPGSRFEDLVLPRERQGDWREERRLPTRREAEEERQRRELLRLMEDQRRRYRW